MAAEEESSREVGHTPRQPLRHQRPQFSNDLRVRPRRRRHQFVRVVAVHHEVVVPARGADEAQRKMRRRRRQVLERESKLEDFCYRHVAGCDGRCRFLEMLEPRMGGAGYDLGGRVLALELSDFCRECLDLVVRCAVVVESERYAQPATATATLNSVLPELVHVVARARGKRQVCEDIPQVALDAAGESEQDAWHGVISWRAIDERNCGDFDLNCVQTPKDRLAFVVALSAGAKDLRVARDSDGAAWLEGEQILVNFDSDFCW